MVKVTVKPDCKNSPKAAQVRDFNISFVNQDKESVLHLLSDDIVWNMIGSDITKGKENVAKLLDTIMGSDIEELIIDNIISHGDRCAANGSMRLTDNTSLAFSDIYIFSSFAKDAKIKEITSYVIDGIKVS